MRFSELGFKNNRQNAGKRATVERSSWV